MTHLYQAGISKTSLASASAVVSLLTPSAVRAEVVEIGIFTTTAVAGEVGLGRPASVGATPTTQQLGVAMDFADVASVVNLVATFTTIPTVPSLFMAKIQLPAIIGAGMVWTWNRGEFTVPVSSSVCIWQLSAAAVGYDAYMKWYE
jgi:hypothetical protein